MSTTRTGREASRIFSTGVTPLDRILGGGIPPYSVVILAGEPGTGKTILSQQILFANATPERKAVYLTTLSEPPMKAARYQSMFDFFDPSKFGESVVYMDIGEVIRREGLGKAADTIADMLRENQPYVVVIDSFKAIHDLADNPAEMRTFIYDLAIELSAMQCTTLLVGEYSESDVARMPEFAVADGIIWLYTQKKSDQQQRYIRILKMRGADHSSTAYNFDIRRNGINIFAIQWVAPPDIAAVRGDQVKTGLPELDLLLRGGIPRGSPMLLSGEAGSGKSTMSMQYLYRGAVDNGEKGIYFTYEETPAQLEENAASFGWDFRDLEARGMLGIHYTPLTLANPDEELIRMNDAIVAQGARRAVIDSLTALAQRISDPDEIRRFVYQLTAMLKSNSCTALVTTDPPVGSDRISRFGVEESIIDGVIVLKNVREKRGRQRYLEVYKLRSVNHSTGDHLMKITSRGIQLFPRAEEVAD
ncbi:MAG: AAA family ATPase [Actinobacteria bacterium]|nr:AAA family ATPase [Actinomycetota bacterium]